jgi:hypothetical protein
VLATAAALAPGSLARAPRPAEPPFTPAPRAVVAFHRTIHVARPSPCDSEPTASPYPWPTEYPWPIEPFHAQHAIRGYFGDPRTVFHDPADPQLGAFSFHNGVDIVAAAGTHVYPVVNGTVTEVRANEAVVESEDGRRIFQYWHIAPDVAVGQRVEAERDVLGDVTAPWRHVHLTEITDGVVQNPLQPGHLTPYRDQTAPTVDDLYIRRGDGRELRPTDVSGTVELVARAHDTPTLPAAPEPWTDLPVSPAVVGFDLTTPDGHEVLPPQTPADFARTEPGNGAFFDVYAPGTFQNAPAVGKHLFRGAAGEYLYELTPHGLDTAALRPGRYVVTVTAVDTCGNTGTLSASIDVVPQPSTGARAHSAAWPRGIRRAWTVVLASIDRGQGLDAAREAARMAAAAGVKAVGVLARPGVAGIRRRSFAVFAGVYFSDEDAGDALDRVRALYPRAFVRELSARVSPTSGVRAGRRTGRARRTRRAR